MDLRRLHLLSELCRLGSMRAVADELGITTSTVSQQLAVLSREAGAVLIEPDGRRIRLTPAGRRLADHAVTILAAVDAARLDLDPAAEPAGTVRVAGFATAIRQSFVPIAAGLAASHPRVALRIREQEPAEAFALLVSDQIDLALTYDYNLAPAPADIAFDATPLWSAEWGLGVQEGVRRSVQDGVSDVVGSGETLDAAAVFDRFRHHHWITNSRNDADEQVIGTIASMAGFEPVIAHRADSLDLVQDLILAGLGVGLLPVDQPCIPGVAILRLRRPDVRLRAYAVTRRGRSQWAPLALITRLLIT